MGLTNLIPGWGPVKERQKHRWVKKVPNFPQFRLGWASQRKEGFWPPEVFLPQFPQKGPNLAFEKGWGHKVLTFPRGGFGDIFWGKFFGGGGGHKPFKGKPPFWVLVIRGGWGKKFSPGGVENYKTPGGPLSCSILCEKRGARLI